MVNPEWSWIGVIIKCSEHGGEIVDTPLRSHTLSQTICKICRWFVKTKTGNTTNLFHHLKKYHPNDHTESMKPL